MVLLFLFENNSQIWIPVGKISVVQFIFLKDSSQRKTGYLRVTATWCHDLQQKICKTLKTCIHKRASILNILIFYAPTRTNTPLMVVMGICLPGYTQQDVSDWPRNWRVGLQDGDWIKARCGSKRLEAKGPGE